MKKFVLILSGLCMGMISANSQKTFNDANVEKRTIESFHGIEVGTGIELRLSQGATEEVAVSASTIEWRDKIITKVENGILKIQYESKWGSINKSRENKNLKAYVSFKTLDKLNATTGSEVKIEGVLKSNTLDLVANTGALVDGEVEIGKMTVSQNTGSKVTLKGKTDDIEIDGDTGSKFRGDDLTTSTCNASVSTGAIISIRAEKELQARANTGGVVRYKGGAVIREVKTNTGGTISRI
jgi:hypothetical protein